MKWTKDKIMARLQEQYNEALKHFPEDRIVGIFLQGSQNYGLATDESDIDSKLIVLPTFEDICFARKPVSTTHICENDEHIDFKDIRLMFQTFRKQNLNFIEILFTEYRIINPLYEDLWNELIAQNELIGRYNLHRAVTTMKGIASEKFHALEHRYPSRVEVIDKFGGYDSKQLHHLIRIYDFIINFIEGKEYSICLRPNEEMAKYLKTIKEFGCEGGLEEARFLANKYFNDICQIADDFRQNTPDKGNPNVDILLDNIQTAIIKKSLLIEFGVNV